MHRVKNIKVFGTFLKPAFLGLAFFEILILVGSLYAGAAIRFGGLSEIATALDGSVWPRSVIFAVTFFISMYAMGLYEPRTRLEGTGLVLRLAMSCLLGAVATTFIYYAVPGLFIGRGAHLIATAIAFILLAMLRYVFSKIVDEDVFKRRVLVYGAGEKARLLTMLRRRSDQRGFSLVGYVPAEGEAIKVSDDKIIDPGEHLVDFTRENQINEIVVAVDDRRQSIPIRSLLQCRLAGIHITDVISFFERETGKVRLDLLYPSWMIFSEGFEANTGLQLFKRIIDAVAAITLLFLTWPIMLLTALAIKLEDGLHAPVLYRQIRVGKDGDLFEVLKFRSMNVNAEKDENPKWASEDDPRITGVGQVIRKFRVDELPQLFNVLVGEMSFVGPRPERPEFVTELSEIIPYYVERHCVKPGITGWAQLCYAYGSSVEDARQKLQYDLYYIKNHSVLFDFQILLQTMEVVLFRKGAR